MNIRFDKKYLTLFIFCMVCSISLVTAAQDTTRADKTEIDNKSVDLKINTTGNRVVELQKFLNNTCYYSGNIDGSFGKFTEEAVIMFQRDSNLKEDGIVGNITQSVIDRWDLNTSSSPTYSSDSNYNNANPDNRNSNSSSDTYAGNSYSNSYNSGITSYYGSSGKGVGDCWDNSEMLYKKLSKDGKTVRIIQYPTSLSSNHRSVQIYQNGAWIDYNYKGNGYKKVYYATKNKSGAIVIK
ncbi:putative peptidoglycan binding domain protein [Methanobrevibacter cuticularis]|uniref:Putative peptidoglycan binding domain protein n=1 Tax=Methanobrevibacter cuticularis TaxID=47311 RepID=A0A166EMB5_9EURY|nr:peptidoglycan-binding protein [Methanobrevibacter cuticularis]KZX16810.1 putative peptidoglycan binding domain protein [Methanobrevibacter cuticularis]